MIEKYIAFRFYLEVIGTITGIVVILALVIWYIAIIIKEKNDK